MNFSNKAVSWQKLVETREMTTKLEFAIGDRTYSSRKKDFSVGGGDFNVTGGWLMPLMVVHARKYGGFLSIFGLWPWVCREKIVAG